MRDSIRVDHKAPGVIINMENGAKRDAVIDDISATGFRVLVVREWRKFAKVGNRVEVRFEFPIIDDDLDIEGEEEICIQGVVRNMAKEGKNMTAFGVQVDDHESRLEKLEKTWLALVFENID